MPYDKSSFTLSVLQRKAKALELKTRALKNKAAPASDNKESMRSLANFKGILRTLEKQLKSTKIDADTGPLDHVRQLSDEAVGCINSDDLNGLNRIVPEMETAIQDIKDANKPVFQAPPAPAVKPFFQSFGGAPKGNESVAALEDSQQRLANQRILIGALPKPLPADRYDTRLISIIGRSLFPFTKLSPERIKKLDELIFYAVGAYFIDALAGIKAELPEYAMTGILNQFILQEEFNHEFTYNDAQGVIFLKNRLNYRKRMKEKNKDNVLLAITPNKETFGVFGFMTDCQLIARALFTCFGERYRNLNVIGEIDNAEKTATDYGNKVFRALNENKIENNSYLASNTKMARN